MCAAVEEIRYCICGAEEVVCIVAGDEGAGPEFRHAVDPEEDERASHCVVHIFQSLFNFGSSFFVTFETFGRNLSHCVVI